MINRLDVLTARALCEAATPGPWEWWTSNSFRRLTGPDGRDGGVLCGVIQRSDNQPDVQCSEADRAFIAAARTLLPLALDRIDTLTQQRDVARLEAQAAFNDTEKISALNVELRLALKEIRRLALARRQDQPLVTHVTIATVADRALEIP